MARPDEEEATKCVPCYDFCFGHSSICAPVNITHKARSEVSNGLFLIKSGFQVTYNEFESTFWIKYCLVLRELFLTCIVSAQRLSMPVLSGLVSRQLMLNDWSGATEAPLGSSRVSLHPQT